jgi:hypothetical protein
MRFLILLVSVLSCGGEVSFTPAEFGSECEVDEQCASGLCITETLHGGDPIEGGMCSYDCFYEETACEEGWCIYNGGDEGQCYPDCRYEECRDGWRCILFFNSSFCVPPYA